MSDDVMQQLEDLFPARLVELSTGEAHQIQPFMVKDFKAVIGLVNKYLGLFQPEGTDKAQVSQLLMTEEGLEDAMTLVQFCSEMKKKDLQSLRMDDLVNLLMTAVEVNSDFLLIRFQETVVRFRELSKLSLQTSSALSSPTATNGTTLAATVSDS